MKREDTLCCSFNPIIRAPYGWELPLPWYMGLAKPVIPSPESYQLSGATVASSGPPAESYHKLLEILYHMDISSKELSGSMCVELGASPGGWTWVLLSKGARVITVDWAPLKTEWIQHHPNLISHHVADARDWRTKDPFYLLVADLSMPPEISLEVWPVSS